jgi:flavorubredoxin
MDNYLEDMKALSLQNRTIAVLGNGSWAPQATKLISAKIKEMKNMRLLEASVTIKSSLKEAQLEELNSLSRQIAEEVL